MADDLSAGSLQRELAEVREEPSTDDDHFIYFTSIFAILDKLSCLLIPDQMCCIANGCNISIGCGIISCNRT